MPSAVRQFQYNDIQIKEDWILDRGTFGKCTKARITHLGVCVPKFLEWKLNMSAWFFLQKYF